MHHPRYDPLPHPLLTGGLAALQPAADACRDCALGAPATQAVADEEPAGAALLRLDPSDRDAAYTQRLDDLRVAARG